MESIRDVLLQQELLVRAREFAKSFGCPYVRVVCLFRGCQLFFRCWHRDAKFGSVMDALNEACKLMQDDKEKASVFGSGLSEWKRVRKEHMERVNQLQSDVQMLLNFE